MMDNQFANHDKKPNGASSHDDLSSHGLTVSESSFHQNKQDFNQGNRTFNQGNQTFNQENQAISVVAYAKVVYILYLCSYVALGISFLIGAILAYVKRNDAQGTIFYSHFQYQIKTFWYSVLLNVLGFITTLLGVGWLILIGTWIWVLYRSILGLTRCLDNKPI